MRRASLIAALTLLASPALVFPLQVAAETTKPLSCDELWETQEGPAFCYLYAPTDASAGLILEVAKDGRLHIAQGEFDFTDSKGKQRTFLADLGAYMPFETRAALNDGRTIEFYGYDSLDGNITYLVNDNTRTYRPFPGIPDTILSPIPDGTYTLANGKQFSTTHGRPTFPDWNEEGMPTYLYPPIPKWNPRTDPIPTPKQGIN